MGKIIKNQCSLLLMKHSTIRLKTVVVSQDSKLSDVCIQVDFEISAHNKNAYELRIMDK